MLKLMYSQKMIIALQTKVENKQKITLDLSLYICMVFRPMPTLL